MPQLKESQFQKDRVLELNQAIDSGSLYQVRQMIKTLPTAGIAHLLESSPPKTRRVLWQLIDKDSEGEVIHFLHEDLKNDI
ncbi:MAG: magnesium transporter, partial [Pseudomonadota bacterium]|nr:magnesium transporter [Pseudomonadota bacterium]